MVLPLSPLVPDTKDIGVWPAATEQIKPNDMNNIHDDLLEGVPAIADFLNWEVVKVYRARSKGWSIPIRKRDGMGLYAFKSELVGWLKAEDALLSSTQLN